MLCRDERPVTQQASGRGRHNPAVAGRRDYSCVCLCVFFKKQRLCIVISNWVNVADCVCIQGCHGLAGFSFNPPPPHTHTLNPHRLIWHFFRVLGHQARKLCLPDRQVIMFNKIPTSFHFPFLFSYTAWIRIILSLWFLSVTLNPHLSMLLSLISKEM